MLFIIRFVNLLHSIPAFQLQFKFGLIVSRLISWGATGWAVNEAELRPLAVYALSRLGRFYLVVWKVDCCPAKSFQLQKSSFARSLLLIQGLA